jgi:lysine-N-methylase
VLPEERPLPQSKLFQPAYAESFRCIGPACDDSCCEEWTVHVDRASFEKLRTLPAGPLRELVDENVLRTPGEGDTTESSAAGAFAQIRMTDSHQCPFRSGDRLCQIQTEQGEAYLPRACATYPRVAYAIDGVKQQALLLSCPEAARQVLLNPRLLAPAATSDGPSVPDEVVPGADPLLPYFGPIRDFVLSLLQNRTYPFWQRLFLIGVCSRRFEALASSDLRQSVPQLLGDLGAMVSSGSLHGSMNTLPVDDAQQLELVLRLAGSLLDRSNARPRFNECMQAFMQGVGIGVGVKLESVAARYTEAHDRYYAPFFQKHPHILENYFINAILRSRFPFGRDWVQSGAMPSMAREFALLATQFALVKGLLIGVAGFHREAFSAAHVVQTVQSVSKHFEHHTEFLAQALVTLVECRMDGARGMAILLRNGKSDRAQAGLGATRSMQPQSEPSAAPIAMTA